MKKYLMILCLMVILTGCGNITEPEANLSESEARPRITEPVTEAATEKVTETVTTASSASKTDKPKSTDSKTKSTESAESANEKTSAKSEKTPKSPKTTTTKAVEPTTEDPKISLRNSVIAEYKSAIQSKIDLVHMYYPNNMYLTYALYDMDKDDVPELLINYGTAEVDRQIAIYTYKNGQLMRLADNIVGSHTDFAYDCKTGQLVLAQGYMGYGDLSWYELDKNGELIFLDKTDDLDFSSNNKPSFDDYMAEYNVSLLDSSEFYQIDYNNDVTWVSVYSAGDFDVSEYDGFNYHLLENYQF